MAVVTNNQKSKLLLLEILKQSLDNHLPWVGLWNFFERNICTASLPETASKATMSVPLNNSKNELHLHSCVLWDTLVQSHCTALEENTHFFANIDFIYLHLFFNVNFKFFLVSITVNNFCVSDKEVNLWIESTPIIRYFEWKEMSFVMENQYSNYYFLNIDISSRFSFIECILQHLVK